MERNKGLENVCARLQQLLDGAKENVKGKNRELCEAIAAQRAWEAALQVAMAEAKRQEEGEGR